MTADYPDRILESSLNAVLVSSALARSRTAIEEINLVGSCFSG